MPPGDQQSPDSGNARTSCGYGAGKTTQERRPGGGEKKNCNKRNDSQEQKQDTCNSQAPVTVLKLMRESRALGIVQMAA